MQNQHRSGIYVATMSGIPKEKIPFTGKPYFQFLQLNGCESYERRREEHCHQLPFVGQELHCAHCTDFYYTTSDNRTADKLKDFESSLTNKTYQERCKLCYSTIMEATFKNTVEYGHM